MIVLILKWFSLVSMEGIVGSFFGEIVWMVLDSLILVKVDVIYCSLVWLLS